MARPENSFGNGRPTDKPVPAPYVYQDYPRVMHHASGAVRHIKSIEQEEEAVAEGYSRQPQDTPVAQATAPKAGECPMCIQLGMENADMKVRFDAMWKKRGEENEVRIEALNARIETQRAEIETLQPEVAEKKEKRAKAA